MVVGTQEAEKLGEGEPGKVPTNLLKCLQVCHKMAIHPYNPDAAAAHTEECIKRHNKLQVSIHDT